MPDAEYYRKLELGLNAEFPAEGAQLDIAVLRFQLENRTKERDEARGRARYFAARIDALWAENEVLRAEMDRLETALAETREAQA